MKRFTRVILKLVTIPLALLFMIQMFVIGTCFVFVEWIYEDADEIWSHKKQFDRMNKSFVQYFKDIFK
jgi:hypothetical protein